MEQRLSVSELVEKFAARELHAARSGREVMRTLVAVANESNAPTVVEIADALDAAVDELLTVMPAYAPPLNAMQAVMSSVDRALDEGASLNDLQANLTRAEADFLRWSEQARSAIARYATNLIPEGAAVFTFTLSETMLRTLHEAWAAEKRFSVLVTESRPNHDGCVTASTLSREGIPVSISIDATVGELLPQADLMMVGAEAIMADGSAICKVGTYPAALVAQRHGVPVFVVVDTLKFNPTSLHGLPLPLSPIKSDEFFLPDACAQAQVVGHLFDRTPANLIRGIISEEGVLSPLACGEIMRRMPVSDRLNPRLAAWARRKAAY